jgi:hypothetical protein
MEFTVGNTVYRAGKLDAFRQLHIVRRLTPCVGKLAGLAELDVTAKKNAAGKWVDVEGRDRGQVPGIFVEAITSLRDEDVEYIINACLDVTERRQAGGKWAPLRVNDTVMFGDLSMPAMLLAVWHVLLVNLKDFISALPSVPGLEEILKGLGLAG